MTHNTSKTCMHYDGGPWDGDEAELHAPPSVAEVEGYAGYAYFRINRDHYKWLRRAMTVSPSLPPLTDIGATPKKRGNVWKWIALFLLGAISILFLLELYGYILAAQETKRDNALLQSAQHIQALTEVLPSATPAPTPVVAPTPVATPTPAPIPPGEPSGLSDTERANQRYHEYMEKVRSSSSSTVLRAEPAGPQLMATMPYGEKVALHYRGILPNQDALPLSGNTIGDAFMIGPHLFVWVQPFGVGVAQWVDPVTPVEVFGD